MKAKNTNFPLQCWQVLKKNVPPPTTRNNWLLVFCNTNCSGNGGSFYIELECESELSWCKIICFLKKKKIAMSLRVYLVQITKKKKIQEIFSPVNLNGCAWQSIGLLSRMFAGRPWFNPRSSHTKDLKKIVLDATLLNIQHYKVRIKNKVEQYRGWSSTLSYTLVW